MDATQDFADVHVLCLSTDYHASTACQHEMDRAIGLDPHFALGIVIPVRLDDAPLPAAITGANPLWVDMRKDLGTPDPGEWQKLLQSCSADLGAPAPAWLAARDAIVNYLERGQSVNLLIRSDGVHWRELIRHIKDEHFKELSCTDLQDATTVPRDGLLSHVLCGLGSRKQVRQPPYDLVDFSGIVTSMSAPVRICLDHFDLAPHRETYDVNLYISLRYLVSERRHLVLLVQSRTPFAALLPRDNPLSSIDIKEVALG